MQHFCCGKLHLPGATVAAVGGESGFEADSGAANLTQHAKVWKGIDEAAEEKCEIA